jgi:NADH:ubiquinone oxidoreductase subunit 5 (subunit L)/multisubunit Na+/H+ antiporter MnhA subunit
MIGFFAKLWVVIGAVERTAYLGVGAIVAAVFTLLYSARFYHNLFFGKMTTKVQKARRPAFIGLMVVFILTLASLISGILFYQPVNYLTGNGGF